MSPSDEFIHASDRHGDQLYPGAHTVACVDDLCVIEWFNVVSDCETPTAQRTLIDNLSGRMYPGLLGDHDQVTKALMRRAERNAARRLQAAIFREKSL